MANLVNPVINGHRYSFASIEMVARGRLYWGFVGISYGSMMIPGAAVTDEGEEIGTTPGIPQHRCEIEMLRHEVDVLLSDLGPGFGLVETDIQVTFDERTKYDEDSGVEPEGVRSDYIYGARIQEIDYDMRQGPGPITARLQLRPRTIAYGAPDRTIEYRPELQQQQNPAIEVED